MINEKKYSIGLDAGSTTLKIVATDSLGDVVFFDYSRHHANVSKALTEALHKLKAALGDVQVHIQVTGSAGMGVSERFGVPFIQEVVAASHVVKVKYPETKTLIDIGGEDSKMIFFGKNMQADIRMNGNCAGGTGAFIDQMAAILGVSVSELSDMALGASSVYPIASRCGVFSKTDIQNLVSLNVDRKDIAASIFHAVANQVLSALSRGCEVLPKIFLCGGPFAFIPALKSVFKEKLGLDDDQIILSEYAQVVPAWGASLFGQEGSAERSVSQFIELFESQSGAAQRKKSGLKPLFDSPEAKQAWFADKTKNFIEKIDFESLEKNTKCFIGVDSGSTTTKIVAADCKERIFFTFYKKNGGRPLETVKEGLEKLYAEAAANGVELSVAGGCSTGYGEDLIKTAFGLDYGMVETIAHYTAAHKLNPSVSFILDIGGQDMKAIFVENGAINRLEINEACSSGCGSFIDNFATSLNCEISDFVAKACRSCNPSDLGTRCTVFMNSKVKQALREGAPVDDISAGLAYSVIKNCLYKVLKLKDVKELGDNIVLQGGTMRNSAVVRAFEVLTNRDVIVSNYPELMGAYGAALYAKRMMEKNGESSGRPLAEIMDLKEYASEPFRCVGCENNCQILKNTFFNGKVYYSGNKCEKVYTNKGEKVRQAFNMSLFRNELAFKKNLKQHNEKPVLTVGIPRALNMYENFQFWYTLLTLCNIEVKSSSRSTFRIYEKGLNTVMADNICFPAKLTHGHIFDLIDKKVDRILFPYVVYESYEKNTNNSFNCPVVSGYSDVLKSAINPQKRFDVPIDSPVINFREEKLLKNACRKYLKDILKDNFSKKMFDEAFAGAVKAQADFTKKLKERAAHTLDSARKENRMLILLAGRPYHNDPLIQHKISEIITSFGVDVVTEDLMRFNDEALKDTHIIPQWSYMNRIMKAAQWVADTADNVHFVQITSFGCGPDAFIIDEINDILKRKNKNLTLLKVDDVNNAGSLKLRIRSLVESLKFRNVINQECIPFETTPEYTVRDKGKKILVTHFSDYHSPFIPPTFRLMGYELESMPPSDRRSAELGLKYANNEICYPATLVVGDCLRAIESGKYNLDEIAFAITQTGGQCRATNYIALIKKALIAAGYGNIPVVSISIMNTINEQSGFVPDIKKGAKAVVYAVLYGDAISKMYYATAVREREKGLAKRLKEEYLQRCVPLVEAKDFKGVVALLKEAALAFDKAALTKEVKRVGVVGEIFIKYNSFGHQNVVNWLVDNGVEPVIPSLTEFFTQYFANAKYNVKADLEFSSFAGKFGSWLGEKWLGGIEKKMNEAAKNFRYFEPDRNIHSEAESAKRILSLAAQFGEGWLIPAEFASFAERGINAAISLQPFGCIANHIVAKGIEKKVKELYPDMNLLFLDFDGGVSEVNVLNRLHFLVNM